jgi:hypothetical protein
MGQMKTGFLGFGYGVWGLSSFMLDQRIAALELSSSDQEQGK